MKGNINTLKKWLRLLATLKTLPKQLLSVINATCATSLHVAFSFWVFLTHMEQVIPCMYVFALWLNYKIFYAAKSITVDQLEYAAPLLLVSDLDANSTVYRFVFIKLP